MARVKAAKKQKKTGSSSENYVESAEDKKLRESLSFAINEAQEAMTDTHAKWKDRLSYYELEPPDRKTPWPGASKLMLPLLRSHCDAVVDRIYRASYEVRPFMTIEAPEVGDNARCKKNEKFIDYQLRIQTDFSTEGKFVAEDSTQIGTGIIFNPWLEETEEVKDQEAYTTLKSFIEKYPSEQDFTKAYKGKADVYYKTIDQLVEGKGSKTITLDITEEVELHNAPNPERIYPFDFVITPGIKEIRKATLVGHKMRKMSWHEIQEKTRSEGWENTENLVKGVPEEDRHKESFEEIYWCIFRYDLDGDKKAERNIVIFDMKSGTILLKKGYTYWHNRPCYIPYYIKKNKNSFWGYSLAEVLQDLNKALNNMFNIIFDSGTLANTPTFKRLKGSSKAFKGMVRFFPGKIFDVAAMDELQQLDIKIANLNYAFNIIMNVERYAEMATGVTAYTLGRTPAADPSAPAKKAEIALHESGYTIGAFIETFQKGNQELTFQMVELDYQFAPDEMWFQVLGAKEGEAQQRMKKEELLRRVNYRPTGTAQSLEKQATKQINTEVFDKLRSDALFKDNVPVVVELIDAYLSSAGGDWEKRKEKILPSEEEVDLMKRERFVQRLQQVQSAEAQMGITGGNAVAAGENAGVMG